jgi:hypothetical protein
MHSMLNRTTIPLCVCVPVFCHRLHGHLRTAVLQARAGLERRAVQARNELIGGNDPEAAQRRQKQYV